MDIKLILVGGKANKSEVALSLPAIVGRTRSADLTVGHPKVSRRHCEFYELDGALVVRDDRSLNGTLVAGERITEAIVKPGDQVTIGPLTFVAVYEHTGDFPVLATANEGAPAAQSEADPQTPPGFGAFVEAEDQAARDDPEIVADVPDEDDLHFEINDDLDDEGDSTAQSVEGEFDVDDVDKVAETDEVVVHVEVSDGSDVAAAVGDEIEVLEDAIADSDESDSINAKDDEKDVEQDDQAT